MTHLKSKGPLNGRFYLRKLISNGSVAPWSKWQIFSDLRWQSLKIIPVWSSAGLSIPFSEPIFSLIFNSNLLSKNSDSWRFLQIKKFFSSFENTLLPVFVFVWYLRLKLQFKYIFLFWHFPDISSSATINIIIAGILILQRQNFRKAQKTQKYVKSNVKAYSEFIPHWVLNGLQSY